MARIYVQCAELKHHADIVRRSRTVMPGANGRGSDAVKLSIDVATNIGSASRQNQSANSSMSWKILLVRPMYRLIALDGDSDYAGQQGTELRGPDQSGHSLAL